MHLQGMPLFNIGTPSHQGQAPLRKHRDSREEFPLHRVLRLVLHVFALYQHFRALTPRRAAPLSLFQNGIMSRIAPSTRALRQSRRSLILKSMSRTPIRLVALTWCCVQHVTMRQHHKRDDGCAKPSWRTKAFASATERGTACTSGYGAADVDQLSFSRG